MSMSSARTKAPIAVPAAFDYVASPMRRTRETIERLRAELGRQIRLLWPDLPGARVLGLGYAAMRLLV